MNKKLGITLIELVVVITLLAVSFSVFGSIIVKGIDITVLYKDYNTARGEAMRSMVKLTQQVRKAKGMTTFDIIEPNDFRFFVNDMDIQFPAAVILNPQNRVGFIVPTARAKKLYFYDQYAYGAIGPGSPYDSYWLADITNQYTDIAGDTFVKFHLTDLDHDGIFQFYGVSTFNPSNVKEISPGNLSDFHDTGYPGTDSARLVKAIISAKVANEKYELGTFVRVRRNNFK